MFKSPVNLPFRKITANIPNNTVYISYGIIAYCLSTRNWFLIRRNYSPEFIFIIIGKYRPSQIIDLIDGITEEEGKILLSIIFENVNFSEIYKLINFSNSDKIEDMSYARNMFLSVLDKIKGYLPHKKDFRQPEWLWPKGGLDSHNETPLECAKREFLEETGIQISDSVIIGNIGNSPLVERIVSFTGKIYETRCWLAIFNKEIQPPPINKHSEIGDRGWKTKDEALKLLKNTKLQIFKEALSIINNIYPESLNLECAFLEHSKQSELSS